MSLEMIQKTFTSIYGNETYSTKLLKFKKNKLKKRK